ncbi:unnamed protein product [Rotaria sp. Silwood2]|nr:unnamed protein product [Rotaria sp. Silwood2]CAF2575257.1 unnamed protein product [Rotaria sp. Silwood2]CAF2823091.1 unnamed protein product [Rotaria sp. Silwood2]CAF2975481.1 unnamed protein product [Rotaria sp. Silwood2]CAF3853116.1 unnamed protein product [Rotaria sp. Silwood2]
MPVGKRTTKVVSYNEQDDDDDFIIVSDNSKKNRNIKSNHISTESKSMTKQQPRKHEEKLPKSEQEQVKMIPQQPKESPEKNLIIIDDKENTNSQSTISSNDTKTSSENLTDVDDQDENLSPKSKRMKHEEEDDVYENESKNENEEELDEEDETSNKISISKTEEIIKKTEMAIISSMDLNKSATDYQNLSTRTSDLSKKRSSAPLGFPTSKINIPSQHVFRVGLSRKSSTIKPLHPNFNSRIVHE